MTRDAQQGEYIITEMRLRGLQAIYGIAEETIAEVMTRPHTPAPETDNQKMSRELRIATSLYKEGRKDGERTATLAENKRVLDTLRNQIELTYSKKGVMNSSDIIDWINDLRTAGEQ